MATVDASTSAILKTRSAEKMETNIFAGNPGLALIQKKAMHGVGGKSFQVALQTGGTVARGKRFADAMALVAVTGKKEMDVAFQEGYCFAYCPGADSALANGGQNSIVDLLSNESDIAYQIAGSMTEQQFLAGDGMGTLAVVDSVVSGTTGTVVFQLVSKSSCNYIYVGDVLAAKSDPLTASLQGGGTWTVTVVDFMLGRITATAAGGADATSYAGYSLGLASTYANSTTPQTIMSLSRMFTRTNLTSAFEGLASRASDPCRLAGHVYSVGTMSAKDAISLLINSIGNFPGAKPEYALVSQNRLLEIEQDLGSKIRYTTTNGSGAGKGATVDIASLTYQAGKGPVTVIGCPALADTDIFVIDPSSLHLMTVGEDLVTPRGEEAQGWLTLQGADAMRQDLRIFGAVYCDRFWANGRAILTA